MEEFLVKAGALAHEIPAPVLVLSIGAFIVFLLLLDFLKATVKLVVWNIVPFTIPYFLITYRREIFRGLVWAWKMAHTAATDAAAGLGEEDEQHV
jgi:uncharacterized protein (DUF983 family)